MPSPYAFFCLIPPQKLTKTFYTKKTISRQFFTVSPSCSQSNAVHIVRFRYSRAKPLSRRTPLPGSCQDKENELLAAPAARSKASSRRPRTPCRAPGGDVEAYPRLTRCPLCSVRSAAYVQDTLLFSQDVAGFVVPDWPGPGEFRPPKCGPRVGRVPERTTG